MRISYNKLWKMLIDKNMKKSDLKEKAFSFSIPEAVIKTALKNMPSANLTDGIYTISKADLRSDELFEKTKREADEYETRIIQQLSEYISVRTGNNTISDEILSQELTCFLVEDVSSHSTKCAEFIGEFVLKNEQNKEIQECLNKIRQGSMLCSVMNSISTI